MSWTPPTLDDVKALGSIATDRDDAVLTALLDTAIAEVTRFHGNRYDFAGKNVLPPVPDQFAEGICFLTLRYNSRRRSLDGQVQAGDASARVPSYDTDVERLLRMGRSAPGIVA